MKLTFQIVLIMFLPIGCAFKTQPIERSYSCFDKDQKIEISYKAEQVFYTRLKSGIGTVAFRSTDGIVRQLNRELPYLGTCSVIKVL